MQPNPLPASKLPLFNMGYYISHDLLDIAFNNRAIDNDQRYCLKIIHGTEKNSNNIKAMERLGKQECV